MLLGGDGMGTVLFYSKTMREEVAREMESGSRADVGCTMGQCRMEDKGQEWCWCHLGRGGWVWSCAESSSWGMGVNDCHVRWCCWMKLNGEEEGRGSLGWYRRSRSISTKDGVGQGGWMAEGEEGWRVALVQLVVGKGDCH